MSRVGNSAWRQANKGKAQQACRRWKMENPAKYLISRTKASAQRRGLVFAISEEDLGALPVHCPILGMELKYAAVGIGNKDPALASIDRIDNSAGYIRGNVVVVSLRANMLKRDATPDELQRLADFYRRQT